MENKENIGEFLFKQGMGIVQQRSESLQDRMEDLLKDIHAENYMGTDDDMVESYERYRESVVNENPLIAKLLN